MKAMLLAAGIGSRMGDLTLHEPKALITLNRKPLIEHVINRLKGAGVSEIIINVYHFADQIIEFISANNNFNIRIEFSREKNLLDTGGGLKNAGWFFDNDKPFILHNVDIISEINLDVLLKEHQRLDALATLAVRKRNTSRQLLFDEEMCLLGWKSTGDFRQQEIISEHHVENLKEYAFLGVHVLSPDIFKLLPSSSKFSIISAYLQIAAQCKRIFGSVQNKGFWIDVGNPQNIPLAESYLNNLSGAHRKT